MGDETFDQYCKRRRIRHADEGREFINYLNSLSSLERPKPADCMDDADLDSTPDEG